MHPLRTSFNSLRKLPLASYVRAITLLRHPLRRAALPLRGFWAHGPSVPPRLPSGCPTMAGLLAFTMFLPAASEPAAPSTQVPTTWNFRPSDQSPEPPSWHRWTLQVPLSDGPLLMSRLIPSTLVFHDGDHRAKSVSDAAVNERVRLATGALARLVASSPSPEPPPLPREGTSRVVATSVRFSAEVATVHTAQGPLRTTPDHLFFVETRGWVRADDLAKGDRLRHVERGYGIVVAPTVVERGKPMPVYNLEVEGTHTYAVGPTKALVHNGTCVPGVEGQSPSLRPPIPPGAGLPPREPMAETTLERPPRAPGDGSRRDSSPLPRRSLEPPTYPRASSVGALTTPEFQWAQKLFGQRIEAPTGNVRGAGGKYKHPSGKEIYVKSYKERSQAYGEHLANRLYRDMGFAAPLSRVDDPSRYSFYSALWEDGLRAVRTDDLKGPHGKNFVKGTFLDKVIENEDLHMDNVLVRPDGSFLRVDNGGAFLFTGMDGLRKTDGGLNGSNGHWGFFYDAIKTSGVTPKELQEMLVSVRSKLSEVRVQAGGWSHYVSKHAPKMNPEDHKAIVDLLTRNEQRLWTHADEILKAYQLAQP